MTACSTHRTEFFELRISDAFPISQNNVIIFVSSPYFSCLLFSASYSSASDASANSREALTCARPVRAVPAEVAPHLAFYNTQARVCRNGGEKIATIIAKYAVHDSISSHSYNNFSGRVLATRLLYLEKILKLFSERLFLRPILVCICICTTHRFRPQLHAAAFAVPTFVNRELAGVLPSAALAAMSL